MIPLNKLPELAWTIEDIPTPQVQRQKLWDVVEKYTGNPLLVQFTAGLIRKYNVPERNELALVRAVQAFVQSHIKFFRERPERFASPLRTIAWGLGDCDDKSIVIATILRSFRIPVRLKFIRFNIPQPDGSVKRISHVYPLAKVNNQWLALESVHKWKPGEDAEDKARAKGIKPEIHIVGDN